MPRKGMKVHIIPTVRDSSKLMPTRLRARRPITSADTF
jgi:hypothetical protein